MPASSYGLDQAADALGVIVGEVGEGMARATLEIKTHHLNGLGSAHGGIIFLLADTVFGYACNSRGIPTVAASCSITYNAAVNAGDVLSAECTETHLSGRSGIYDAVVKNQNGTAVAHFRGNSLAPRKS